MSANHHTSAAADLARRAQAALERGERESLALFDQAIRSDPGNAMLWLGKANALFLNGDKKGAMVVAGQLADQAPSLLQAQALLAQLRLAAGDHDFTSHYDKAAVRHPQDPNIWVSHCDVLAGLDLASDAAEVAARARTAFTNEPHFALLEAIYASAAGQWDRAEANFASLPQQSPDRWLHEARHRIRGGDPHAADTLLDRVMAQDPWDISAWALRGIAWRLLDDPRAHWLHGQEGLVQFRPLEADPALIASATDYLRDLHENATMPLGQSLRGGSQTVGILLDRQDQIMTDLRQAIMATLENYRADLQPIDPSHPLLRHRDADWTLKGSWSVRLAGGGDHHTAHIHPQGIISSALYLVVPDDAQKDGKNGWLEIGRPPSDLGLDLAPLRAIQPKAGHLALFPSTLYHGTTAFSASERMTVAFDVTASNAPVS